MFCRNCGKQISEGAAFCGNCGTKIETGAISYQNYSQKVEVQTDPNSICEICLQNKSTHYIDLYENVGALVVRYNKQIKGKLCFDCQKFVFWRFTLKTLFLGWWGVISFIITPFILLNNIIRYSINYYKFKKT